MIMVFTIWCSPLNCVVLPLFAHIRKDVQTCTLIASHSQVQIFFLIKSLIAITPCIQKWVLFLLQYMKYGNHCEIPLKIHFSTSQLFFNRQHAKSVGWFCYPTPVQFIRCSIGTFWKCDFAQSQYMCCVNN